MTVEAVAKAFPTLKAHWSVSPPTFNPEQVTKDVGHPRHVVLEVESNETHGWFDKPGFYTLEGITPKEVAVKLNLVRD